MLAVLLHALLLLPYTINYLILFDYFFHCSGNHSCDSVFLCLTTSHVSVHIHSFLLRNISTGVFSCFYHNLFVSFHNVSRVLSSDEAYKLSSLLCATNSIIVIPSLHNPHKPPVSQYQCCNTNWQKNEILGFYQNCQKLKPKIITFAVYDKFQIMCNE